MIDIKKEKNSKIAVFLIVGILIGFFIGSFDFNSKSSIKQDINDMYSLVTETPTEIVTMIEENGLYKVLVKNDDQINEVYVTKDGEKITYSLIDLQNFKQNLEQRKDFFDCLSEKNFVMYGTNNTATVQQIQLLGQLYTEKITMACVDDVKQQCIDAGITQFPTFVYKGQGYPGLMTVEQIENLTNCTLGE